MLPTHNPFLQLTERQDEIRQNPADGQKGSIQKDSVNKQKRSYKRSCQRNNTGTKKKKQKVHDAKKRKRASRNPVPSPERIDPWTPKP